MKKALMYIFLTFCILSLLLRVFSYIFDVEVPSYIEVVRELIFVLLGFYIVFTIIKEKG